MFLIQNASGLTKGNFEQHRKNLTHDFGYDIYS